MSMKDSYEDKLQAQLDQWSADIDKLKAEADEAEADVQLELYQEIEALRSMQEEASSKLIDLKDAGEDVWEDMKAGIENAWDSLGNMMKSLASKFK